MFHYRFSWFQHCILHRPFLSFIFPRITLSLFAKPLNKYENVFPLQVYFHENQAHFHAKRCAQGLAMKQKHILTRKWPIVSFLYTLYSQDTHTERALLMASRIN